MIIVRIRHKLRQRASEWFLASLLAGWGVVLVHPAVTYDGLFYRYFSRHVSEDVLGMGIGLVGMLWLAGLIINGAMDNLTSTVRAVCAGIGAITFGLWGFGFFAGMLMTGQPATSMWTGFLASGLSLYCLFQIMQDKRRGV